MFCNDESPSLFSQAKEKASSFFESLATSSAKLFCDSSKRKEKEYKAAMKEYDALLQDTLSLFDEIKVARTHFREQRLQINHAIDEIESKNTDFFRTRKNLDSSSSASEEKNKSIDRMEEVHEVLNKLLDNFPELPKEATVKEINNTCSEIQEYLAQVKSLYSEFFAAISEFQGSAFETIDKCSNVEGVRL